MFYAVHIYILVLAYVMAGAPLRHGILSLKIPSETASHLRCF